MSNKKRRLSPSLSSRPPSPVLAPSDGPFDEASVPAPGPSRVSASVPASVPIKEERTVGKQATLVLGSGDGCRYGEECFLWTDLPMNKQGESALSWPYGT